MNGQRGFVMVPAWLLVKKPTGNDVLVYCTLASHGTWNPATGTYDSCKPSIDLMVQETDLSRSTVKRSLDNLIKLKAIDRTLQFTEVGDPAPSLYRVIFGTVVEPGQPAAPAEGEGVGSPVDRPQRPAKKASSKGGRSTGEPGGSVHGRTEGRSTDGPRVGPQVDRNQEPLNQEPDTKKENPVAGATGETVKSGSAQTTIDGTEESLAPREATLTDLANEDARIWAEHWKTKGSPIAGDQIHAKLRSVILKFLKADYTVDEVREAFRRIGAPVIPTPDRVQRELATVRGVAVAPVSGAGRGAGAAVNDHWNRDKVPASVPAQIQKIPAPVAPRAQQIQTTGGAW